MGLFYGAWDTIKHIKCRASGISPCGLRANHLSDIWVYSSNSNLQWVLRSRVWNFIAYTWLTNSLATWLNSVYTIYHWRLGLAQNPTPQPHSRCFWWTDCNWKLSRGPSWVTTLAKTLLLSQGLMNNEDNNSLKFQRF